MGANKGGEVDKGLIIIDGPDASGKTTLAKEIVLMSGGMGRYIHMTWSPTLAPVADHYNLGMLYWALEESKSKVIVIDRLYLSELIYAGIFRGGSQFKELAYQCEQIIYENRVIVITAVPAYDWWLYTFNKCQKERPEMYENISDMERVYWTFYFVYWGRHAEKCGDIKSQYLSEMMQGKIQPYMCRPKHFIYQAGTERIQKSAFGFLNMLREDYI